MPGAIARVDITIPVLNEARCIEKNVTSLARYLDTECPYDWSITVVDNGSTDGTWAIARSMSESSSRVRAIHLDRRGRGGALKQAWTTSDADIVAYMDVDLSTGLDGLQALLDPIVMGEADVSIGSRLARGAEIRRSLRREVISRIYNVITRSVFGYSVRDAQCGFKAVRSEVARTLVPKIEDDGWFFDTELLVLAWREGLRISEVPVRWIEDDDSRVKIVKTGLDDLRGIRRLQRDSSAGRPPGTTKPSGGSVKQVVRNRPDLSRRVDFDEHAADYQEAVDRSVAFTGRDSAFFAQRKVEILQSLSHRLIGDLKTLSVLDVGCGTGTSDRYLIREVRELQGVDVSEEMLALAQAQVPQASYEWYDGEKLPFPDDSFDIALAICVLHHVPESSRPKFLSELSRVARPEGLVAVFEHNPLNPLTRRAVNSCELDRDVKLLRARRTKELFELAGATDVSERFFLFTPFGGALGRLTDQALRVLPLGGQYVVVGRPPTLCGGLSKYPSG